MPHPSHPFQVGHPDCILQGIQILIFLIMKFSPASSVSTYVLISNDLYLDSSLRVGDEVYTYCKIKICVLLLC
jgi:hypothetical protein